MTLLKLFVHEYQETLEDLEYVVSYDGSRLPSSCSANIDSAKYVCTITHWPNTRFEIQLCDYTTGAELVLESFEVDNFENLANYLLEIFNTFQK